MIAQTPARRPAIPARVRDEITRREGETERLIGWAQLAVVVFFATLYAIAPRAEGGTGENFVPLTLAAYFAFTLLRLYLSFRITLPRWYLMVSVVVDMALLCGLIFSFHIQYGQIPAFYLKAPTLMYVFLFISLRALRFDPQFVLTAGLVGAAGWLALVAYAVVADMGNMHVTRNYVEYLTSNSILIGAEIDKVLTILGVTAILTFAIHRGRSLLIGAVESTAAVSDLRQFFAPEVAHSITAAADRPAAGRGEVREATILFVDVRSFTTTAESLPPEAVVAVLTRYQSVVLRVIEAQGGQIDKFLGDGILATFGAVAADPGHAASALGAATAIVDALTGAQADFAALGWPGVFRVGVGVASGRVVTGVVGAEGRYEFTVIGNAVNRAAKFEAANKPLGTSVLTDAETLALARAQGFAADPADQRKGVIVSGLGRPADLIVLA